MTPEIICIGSVLWDVIGRSDRAMEKGSDVPGRITRLPGGVALNIAMTLGRFGLRPALLSAVGRDEAGASLIASCQTHGLITDHVYLSEDLPTDQYMAVEGANGLIAAIADAHSLEQAGDKILKPLADGAIGSHETPFAGVAAIDGNMTIELLQEIARGPLLAQSDLRIAPASPGKADRLQPFIKSGRGTLYVNLEEAEILCQSRFDTAEDAAKKLLEQGAHRVLVTNGDDLASEGSLSGIISEKPPKVLVTRVTGAGDTFMAAHIAAELRGQTGGAALKYALETAAAYVSGKTPS